MDVLVKDVKKEAPWNMMFADDVVLCEQSIDRLEEKLEDWRKALEERGMKISRTKSEYLAPKDVQMRSCKIQDDELKSVCKFKYLGSYIQRDGRLEITKGNSSRKISPEAVQTVYNFINNVHKYASYYSRSQNPNEVYCDHDMLISLYEERYLKYCEENNAPEVKVSKV
ncbi:uncharacterized protein LOC124605889 [Schistocerca americana]|uniref:uncharacterized protein LOC124605889 n=1 Tax=Schistocerca americana TaxID=7009 RepID=UPI001F502B82|nr:uncharacterized protein LOC124605889 [Schistocerca americana]